MATPPPNLHGWKPQQSVRWKTPDNPGAWCLTNHCAHNRTILQTMAANRKSPGSAANYVENCITKYLESNFQYAKARGCVRYDCTDEAGKTICAHAGTECLCDIKADMRHWKTTTPHDGSHPNPKMTHVTRSKRPQCNPSHTLSECPCLYC